jgi:uncharacterized membrane protein YkoI
MNPRRLLNLTLILSLSGLLVTGCGLWKKEIRMTMDELPAPVRIAMQKVTAGSTVMQIEKIESGGKVTYEVEYRKDGKDHETYFAEDGTIVKGAQ